MKLLDVTEFYSLRGGGVRSHLERRGQLLCQLGHSHTILAPGPVGKEPNPLICRETAGKSSTVFLGGPSLPYDPTYHLLWRLDRVRRIAQREDSDVLEAHSPYVAAWSLAAVPRRPGRVKTLVWHSDFIDTYLGPMLEERLGTRARRGTDPLWGYVRLVASRFDAVVTASKWQADKLVAHGVESVVTVPFGVDRHVFYPGAPCPEWRARFLGEREGPLLLAIGRLAREKHMGTILDAFARLRGRMGGAALVVLGDGPERASLEARGRAIGRVHFLGFERDRHAIAQAFRSADALVHACPYETFGLGVAEALACGLAAVLPDQGGAAEHAPGPSVVQTRALDPEALAQGIIELLGRDQAARQAASSSRAHAIESEHDHTARMLELYASLGRSVAGGA